MCHKNATSQQCRCFSRLVGLLCAGTVTLAAPTRHGLLRHTVPRASGSLRGGTATNGSQTVVFIDAGSSGSKVYSYSPEGRAKLETHCSADHQSAGNVHQGVASLAYAKEECAWLINWPDHEVFTPLHERTDYSSALLNLLADVYMSASGKSHVEDVINRDAVPMLATGGMRLLSRAQNDRVWHDICGRTGAGFTIAPHGDKCGTIAGTTEAFYEFLAVTGVAGNVSGTFSIGGMSAQISIPLKSSDDVMAFQQLKESIAGELECSALTLADGSQIPSFAGTGAAHGCIDDFVLFKPRSEIPALSSESEIEGVGLISFLGMQGKGSLVAGGLNAIKLWSQKEGCDGNGTTFSTCVSRLQDALSQDILWKHVTEYFHTNVLDIHSFSYSTPAAIPELLLDSPAVSGQDQALDLQHELQRMCSSNNGARFGHKESITCMMGWFSSLFVTSFFHTGSHSIQEVDFDPDRGWPEGTLMEAGSRRTPPELLSAPLRSHTVDYTHGARAHFGHL